MSVWKVNNKVKKAKDNTASMCVWVCLSVLCLPNAYTERNTRAPIDTRTWYNNPLFTSSSASASTSIRSLPWLLIHQISAVLTVRGEGQAWRGRGGKGRRRVEGGSAAHMCLVIRCRNYFTRLSHFAVGKADAGKLHKCWPPSPFTTHNRIEA